MSGNAGAATLTIELPSNLGTAACAAALADVLHVLVADDTTGTSAHVLFDPSTGVVTRLGEVGLFVADVASAADALLVTGDDGENGDFAVAVIDTQGTERWRTTLTAEAPLTRAPIPLMGGTRAALVWEESDDERSTLAFCRVHDRACGPTQRIALPGTTHRLDAVMTSAGIVVMRLSGFPPLLTLMRISDGDIAMRRDVPEAGHGPVACASTGDGIAVAWVDAGEVHARTFDANLESLGAGRSLGRVGTADRLSGHSGRRTAFIVTRWGGKAGSRDDCSESLVFFDDGVQVVPLPIGQVECGGWIGNTFVLVHGDTRLAVSAFERIGRRR